jgi:hypothetical protein
MFGMAVSCRPHLAIAGVIALAAVGFRSRRRALALGLPLLLVGLGIAAYNYARFGNPLEFGNRYLVGSANQTELRLSRANVAPGLCYMLLSPPEFSPVFPWVRMPAQARDIPRPASYTVEPTVGALWLAPFLPGIVLVFFARRGRVLLWIPIASAVLVLLFIAGTGWSTERYAVDFLGLAILGTLGAFAAVAGRGWSVLLGVLIVAGAAVNLSTAISGPYDEMLQNRPARYVSIARWFSPVAKYRPALNPPVAARVTAAAGTQLLFRAGRKPFRYELSIESAAGNRSLVSRYREATVRQPLDTAAEPLEFEVRYVPGAGEMRVASGERVVLVHRIGALVTAPADVAVNPR